METYCDITTHCFPHASCYLGPTGSKAQTTLLVFVSPQTGKEKPLVTEVLSSPV